jgi:hypothetical protein
LLPKERGHISENCKQIGTPVGPGNRYNCHTPVCEILSGTEKEIFTLAPQIAAGQAFAHPKKKEYGGNG